MSEPTAAPSFDAPSAEEEFDSLLTELRSDEPHARMPAVAVLRERRLQEPAQVAAIIDLWQQASNEHVRAGAGEVLVSVPPPLLAPHIAAMIDGLADASSFARLCAVGILQKMLGHGILTPEVLRAHDARLMAALHHEHCDDAVRDLVGNEIMTLAFAPGGPGAASASASFYAAAAGGSSAGGGGVAAAGSSSADAGSSSGADAGPSQLLEELRAVLGAGVPEALLLSLLERSGHDLNLAANLYMNGQVGDGAIADDGVRHIASAQLDGTLPQHPLAMRVASGDVAQGNLDGTLPQHPGAVRVAAGTIATVAEA